MVACDDGAGNKVKLELERRDWVKIGGFVLGLLTVAMTAMMYVFQTRATAIVEHAEIETTAKLLEQRTELLREFDQKRMDGFEQQTKDNKAILKTLDDNQRTVMREMAIPKRRMAPLPSGISFDDLEPAE